MNWISFGSETRTKEVKARMLMIFHPILLTILIYRSLCSPCPSLVGKSNFCLKGKMPNGMRRGREGKVLFTLTNCVRLFRNWKSNGKQTIATFRRTMRYCVSLGWGADEVEGEGPDWGGKRVSRGRRKSCRIESIPFRVSVCAISYVWTCRFGTYIRDGGTICQWCQQSCWTRGGTFVIEARVNITREEVRSPAINFSLKVSLWRNFQTTPWCIRMQYQSTFDLHTSAYTPSHIQAAKSRFTFTRDLPSAQLHHLVTFHAHRPLRSSDKAHPSILKVKTYRNEVNLAFLWRHPKRKSVFLVSPQLMPSLASISHLALDFFPPVACF